MSRKGKKEKEEGRQLLGIPHPCGRGGKKRKGGEKRGADSQQMRLITRGGGKEREGDR